MPYKTSGRGDTIDCPWCYGSLHNLHSCEWDTARVNPENSAEKTLDIECPLCHNPSRLSRYTVSDIVSCYFANCIEPNEVVDNVVQVAEELAPYETMNEGLSIACSWCDGRLYLQDYDWGSGDYVEAKCSLCGERIYLYQHMDSDRVCYGVGRLMPQETVAGTVSADEFLAQECIRLREAGCDLAMAAARVVATYDGTHRLALALSRWWQAVGDEGGRPHSTTSEEETDE